MATCVGGRWGAVQDKKRHINGSHQRDTRGVSKELHIINMLVASFRGIACRQCSRVVAVSQGETSKARWAGICTAAYNQARLVI